MTFVKPLLVALAGTGALGACSQGCSDDPSQVGLACATSNLMSGTYREGDAAIERQLGALRIQSDALMRESQALQAEAATLRGERRRAAEELAATSAETARLQRELAGMRADVGSRETRLAELRTEARALGDAVQGADPADAAEIRGLEARRAALRAEVDELVEVMS